VVSASWTLVVISNSQLSQNVRIFHARFQKPDEVGVEMDDISALGSFLWGLVHSPHFCLLAISALA